MATTYKEFKKKSVTQSSSLRSIRRRMVVSALWEDDNLLNRFDRRKEFYGTWDEIRGKKYDRTRRMRSLSMFKGAECLEAVSLEDDIWKVVKRFEDTSKPAENY